MEERHGPRVKRRAIDIVKHYYETRGRDVRSVSQSNNYGGYDLLVGKGAEEFRVSVKGCTQQFGIPDPYGEEFDPESRKLIADVLCVVYFIPLIQSPRLAIIPRAAIPFEFVIPKTGYRLSGRFKNERTLSKFIVSID